MLIPIRLPICNVFLLTGERPILIDTGRPKDLGRIEAALRQHGVGFADLSLVLHTHAHWDHCGSTAEMRKYTSAVIAVHAADAERMRQGINGPLKPTNFTAWALHWFLNRRYPPTEPTLVLQEEISLAAYGVDARLLYTPGHTPGSISILTGEGEIMVGDLIMGGWLGGKWFRQRPGLHYFVEDMTELRASLRKVLALSPKCIYPAHGGPLDPAAVERWLAKQT